MRRVIAFVLLQCLVPLVGIGTLLNEHVLPLIVSWLASLPVGLMLWASAGQRRHGFGFAPWQFARATVASVVLWASVWGGLALATAYLSGNTDLGGGYLFVYALGLVPLSVGCQAGLRLWSFRSR